MTHVPAEELLQRLADNARQLAGANLVSIALLEQAGLALDVVVSQAEEKLAHFPPGYRLPLHGTAGGTAVREGRSVVIADMARSDTTAELREFNLRRGLHSAVATPLLALDRCVGVLFAHYRRPNGGTPRRVRLLEGYATGAALAIANAQLVEEARRLSSHNQLILNSAGEGIYGVDASGKSTFVNPAAAHMLGYEVGELTGKNLHAFSHHSRPDGSAYPRAECPIYAAFVEGSMRQVDDEVFWRKDATSFPVEYTSAPLRDEDGQLVGAVVVFQDITERVTQRIRREALLRVARRFAAEANPQKVLAALLHEAAAVAGGDGGTVRRWDEDRQLLLPVWNTISPTLDYPAISIGQGVNGRAIALRRPVIIDDYQRECGHETPSGRLGVRSAVAVPLLFEGRLLGSLAVTSFDEAKRFTADDAEILELLAANASATLAGLERARLEGALLAARTAQHEMNNKLAVTTGLTELLAADASLPPHLIPKAREIANSAMRAAKTLDMLKEIGQIRETHWSGLLAPTIDLHRSQGGSEGSSAPGDGMVPRT